MNHEHSQRIAGLWIGLSEEVRHVGGVRGVISMTEKRYRN